MDAIGHLQGVWCGLAAGQGIGLGTVTDQNGAPRMRLQPRRQGLGGAPFEDG
jgi:hypothetical protein